MPCNSFAGNKNFNISNCHQEVDQVNPVKISRQSLNSPTKCIQRFESLFLWFFGLKKNKLCEPNVGNVLVFQLSSYVIE